MMSKSLMKIGVTDMFKQNDVDVCLKWRELVQALYVVD